MSAGPVHRCHAKGCARVVAYDRLMCLRHWRMVPLELQREVWSAYRRSGSLSEAWLEAVRAAIAAVATFEAAHTTRSQP